MTSTNFVPNVTVIEADWLNDVNTYVYDGYLNVKSFGAVGDGVTDDTAAIQAAINSGAKEVFFPEGTYVVSNLTGASNQVLNGQNVATLLALTGSTSATTFISFTNKQNYEVKNFTFDGNVLNSTNLNTAITNNGGSYFSYTNNTWKNCNGISIFIGTSSYVEINNNTFINCGIYYLTTGVAADRKQAIAFTTCNYAVANDNFFNTVGLDCISFATNCFNVQACRNITKDNYASAIYVSLTTRFVLSDNISYAENVSGFFSGNGLDVINSKEGTISNNVNVNRGSAGITVVNCFGVTISGNLCKNNNKSGNGAGSGGIVIGTSTAGGATPRTDNIVATGNVCYDDQGVGAVTQRFGIYKQKQSTSVFNRIVIDTSNNLSGYDSGGNPATGNAISSTFGLVGYPIEFNLTTGSSLDLCPADVYGVFSVTQLNNPSYYAQVFIRGASTPILLLDPASQWTAGTGGTKQNVLYDAVSGTIQLQNNTGSTRTYLVTDNRITLAEI